MRSLTFLLVVFFALSLSLKAQNGELKGTVYASDGSVIPGAHVSLNDKSVVISNASGKYSFTQLPAGTYSLKATFIGFQPLVKQVQLTSNQSLTLDLSLEELATELSQVVVTGESEASQLKQSVAAVALLDAKPFYNRSVNTPDLLNTISGVQVRQSGGVGNSTDISIQGLSGRQEPMLRKR